MLPRWGLPPGETPLPWGEPEGRPGRRRWLVSLRLTLHNTDHVR